MLGTPNAPADDDFIRLTFPNGGGSFAMRAHHATSGVIFDDCDQPVDFEVAVYIANYRAWRLSLADAKGLG